VVSGEGLSLCDEGLSLFDEGLSLFGEGLRLRGEAPVSRDEVCFCEQFLEVVILGCLFRRQIRVVEKALRNSVSGCKLLFFR